MKARFSKSLITIILASILMAVISLPSSVKESWPDNGFVNFFKKPKITLGLDLQGGTQLDYRIDLRNVQAKNTDDDDSNDVSERDIIEGVRTTIERRVNGLGVSEPQIYLSNVAGEQHIIVELAGIKDINEAKAVVGKTIQLEFKERKTEIDPDEKTKIEAEAKKTLEEINAEGVEFEDVGNKIMTPDAKIDFRANKTSWISALSPHYKGVLDTMEVGSIHTELLEGVDGIYIENQDIKERKGLYIVKLLNKEVKERTVQETYSFDEVAEELELSLEDIKDQPKESLEPEIVDAVWGTEDGKYTDVLEVGEELRAYKVLSRDDGEGDVKASHILIAYQGSERANEEVTRSQEEAKEKAEEVLEKVLEDPDKFADLAGEFSDGPSGPNGGDLGFFGRGQMTQAFEDAAFAMEVDEVSGVVETEFGYHIIKLTDKNTGEAIISLQLLRMTKTDENRLKLEEVMAKTEPFDVTKEEEELEFHEIYFDLTPDNWKTTGLDGSHFKYATVIYGELGDPQVNIYFDNEGGDMFEDITDRLTGEQLAIFVGGQLISAPRVNQKITGGSAVITGNFTIPEALQLANDLNTGAIDAPVILSGQYTISATLGENALKVSLIAGLIGLALLAAFMILYYRLMGIIAVIALLIYSIIIVFILNVTGIVMTLAGIAGIILSIGMAVDANILIFERTKEELNSGKNFIAAISAGFERAWSSIRDSNVSSLITCAILWFFGNSIIRGFALMLAIGILVSMFTAITVTRKFLQAMTGTKLSKNKFLLGAKELETINR